jgi:hypothetical protein|tara:strand:- start:4485 stop:4745 length:261 start_codon:yes stop_codon:yes gene_type:complete
MWQETEITIGGKKVNAQVNKSNDMIEIEMMFDLKLLKSTSVTIDSKDYKIESIEDVGERGETLKITIEDKNNDKPVKSRNDTKISK